MFKYFKKKISIKGFSLIEVTIALSIIIVGVVGSLVIVSKGVAITSEAYSRLTAAYLAQEGIEIVRNIRDGNFLEARDPLDNSPWNEELDEGEWEMDYLTPEAGDPVLNTDYWEYGAEGVFLKIDAGNYNYSTGQDSKYKRKITIDIDDTNSDKMTVISAVEWSEKGETMSFAVQEDLYNWR